MAGVGPHAEDRLGFIDDDHQPSVPSRLDDGEHTSQVVQGIPAADVALDAGHLLRRRGHVAAPAKPGNQGARLGHLSALLQVEDRGDDSHEVLGRLTAGDGRELQVQTLADLVVKVVGVFVGTGCDEGIFDAPYPPVEDVPQGAPGAGVGGQLRDDLAIHVVELVELQIVVRDHDEAGGEVVLLRIEQGEPGHEGLAAAVAAAQELDAALVVADELELTLELAPLALDAYGERVDPALRYEARAEGLEDVLHVP